MRTQSSEPRRPATVRVARWSATHPGRAIGMWLVFVVVCIAIGQVAGLKQITDLDTAVGQSGRAAHQLHDAHLESPASENVLISGRAGALDTAIAQRAAADLSRRMKQLPEVATVDAPASAKGALLVGITMRGDAENADDHVQPLLNATAAVQKAYPALRVEEAGDASLDKAVNNQVGKDLGAAGIVSLPVTLVILMIAFGAIIAAGVPVLLALSAVGSAIGISTLVSHFLPDSGTTSSMILLMGMAVGVDYSLFYVKRAREEHARGLSRLDAIELAAETSGHSVLVSGVAVIVSMIGLFLAHDAVFSSLAAGSIIVVAIAVLGSLTVLPAALVKLGRRIDRPRVPVLWRLANSSREPRLWPALLKPAINSPGRALGVSALGLVILALPALGLTLHSDTAKSLPRVIPAVQTLDRISAAFPGQQTTQEIVVRAPAAQSATVNSRLQTMADQLSGNALFAVSGSDRPTLQTSADGTVHALRVDVPFDSESKQAKQGLHELRSSLVPQAISPISGA
jgi:RND superfamily putative drug exporter